MVGVGLAGLSPVEAVVHHKPLDRSVVQGDRLCGRSADAVVVGDVLDQVTEWHDVQDAGHPGLPPACPVGLAGADGLGGAYRRLPRPPRSAFVPTVGPEGSQARGRQSSRDQWRASVRRNGTTARRHSISSRSFLDWLQGRQHAARLPIDALPPRDHGMM